MHLSHGFYDGFVEEITSYWLIYGAFNPSARYINFLIMKIFLFIYRGKLPC